MTHVHHYEEHPPACRDACFSVRDHERLEGRLGVRTAKRLRQLNVHVPSEVLGGQRWTGNDGGLLEKWAKADQAYAMEQRVLNAFDKSKKYGERVHCTGEQMETAWFAARKG